MDAKKRADDVAKRVSAEREEQRKRQAEEKRKRDETKAQRDRFMKAVSKAMQEVVQPFAERGLAAEVTPLNDQVVRAKVENHFLDVQIEFDNESPKVIYFHRSTSASGSLNTVIRKETPEQIADTIKTELVGYLDQVFR